MANMSYNKPDHMHQSPDPKVDVPGAVDSRPPQLDKIKSRDRCGCACASSRGNGEDGGERGGTAVPESPVVLPSPLLTAPNPARGYVVWVHGNQGVEEHSIIEVGDLGRCALRDILADLIRHGRYMPELSLDAEPDRYTSIGSPTMSMLVEGCSDSDYMASRSSCSIATRSTSSGQLVAHTGTRFPDDHDLQHSASHHFIADPMWLGHELDFCSNMIVGGRYPMDLSMTEERFDSEFDEY